MAALRANKDPIQRCLAAILMWHVGFVLTVSTLAILNA